MRFVVLGDLHYGLYPEPQVAAAYDQTFESFFRQVAIKQADLVFAIGDTTNLGIIEEFVAQDELAARAGLHLIRLTGNHDSDSLEKAEMSPYFLGDHPSTSLTELYTSFDFGIARFILLDTARVKMSSVDYGGIVSPEQLAWLEGEIESFNNSDQSLIIVLGHHPLANTTARSSKEMLNISNSAEVKVVFGKVMGKPGVYICGHNHWHSLVGPDEQGWYFVQAGAPLESGGFRLFTLDEQGLRVETVDFNLSDPTLKAAFEIAQLNMAHFSAERLPSAYGAPSDRKIIIPF